MELIIRVIPIYFYSLFVLVGCTSSNLQSRSLNQDDYSLYLRGDMSNWSVLPNLIAQPVKAKYFTAQTTLKANHTYHFKFADKEWTPSRNFGAAADQSEITEGKSVPVSAYGCLNELSFTPDQDGKYVFTLDLTGKRQVLRINKK